MWTWPLKSIGRTWPDSPGQFGTVRKHDIHTGVDLYCIEGTVVVAVEDGFVVAIEEFTGTAAKSPWWHNTQAILVEGMSGVVCYGEVAVSEALRIGDRVSEGQPLGTVKTVLRKDKGRPMTMLHIELYQTGTVESVWWNCEHRPENLCDPTKFLKGAFFS